MDNPQYKIYKNPNGPAIGTVKAKILEQDGLCFKDLAGTGQLLPYEDWRLPAEERAKDLASRLSVEEIAGLMLYSIRWSPPSPMAPSPAPMAASLFLRAGQSTGP